MTTTQTQRTTGRKEHLSAAEYNTRRAAIETGAMKKPLGKKHIVETRTGYTAKSAEQIYNKDNLPNLGFVETNASYEIGGVQYLPHEVFDRKHSVYDAIVTGIGRTDLPRDVFARAKPEMVEVALKAISDAEDRYKRYPSFINECYGCYLNLKKAHESAVKTALDADSPSIDIESLKDVMVGNALRNEIQVAAMHGAIRKFGGNIRNMKLG